MDFLENKTNVSQLLHWFTALQITIFQRHKRWWYTEDRKRIERNKGELLALIHSEISEVLEAVRQPGMMDKHLPHRSAEAVKLADAIIRILDYAEGNELNVIGAMIEKLEYNKTFAGHTYEAARKGGKQF